MNTSENNPAKNPQNRRFVVAFLFLAAVGATLAVYGFFIEPDRLVVNSQSLSIPKWDKKLDGLKIVLIGDVHGGSSFIDEAKIRLVVETANAQDADITVLLGDYVSQIGSKGPMSGRHLKMPMATIAKVLGGLRAKHGVFAVIGNHDDWYNGATVTQELENAGITVLVDKVFTIETNGSKIHLLGMRDLMNVVSWQEFQADAKALAEQVPDGELILLDHNPDIVPYIVGTEAIADNLSLVLAAHTHGGQVWLPVIGSPIVPSEYGQRFAYGHSVEDGVDVFVTTGVGTSILPVRFLVPPEIVVLTIRSQ